MEHPGGRRRGVLLLHGMGLHPLWNRLLARDLRRQGHEPVLNWGYPRRTQGISGLAQEVAGRLRRRFPGGVPPLHAAGHSMGGLIIRRLLADGFLPPGGRVVFMGVPHRGARKAEVFGHWWFMRALYGASFQDLRPGSAFLAGLPQPPAGQVLSVVGGRGGLLRFSFVLREDHDGTVEVSSARMPGTQECFVRGVHHGLLPVSRRVRRAACSFLGAAEPGAAPPAAGGGAARPEGPAATI